jgi:hypothetical protein
VASITYAAAAGVAGWPPRLVQVLRAVIGQYAAVSHADACRLVSKRRDLGAKNHEHGTAVAELADQLPSAPDLFGLFAELIAADKATWWDNGHSSDDAKAKAFWKTWGVDRAKLMAQAMGEQKSAKGKPKAKGKKRAPAKATA